MDAKLAAEQSIAYWNSQSTEDPNTVQGFDGTWAISEHALIPGTVLYYIEEMFHTATRLKRIPMKDINQALNDAWEGPGSMAKLVKLTFEAKQRRLLGEDYAPTKLIGYDIPAEEAVA